MLRAYICYFSHHPYVGGICVDDGEKARGGNGHTLGAKMKFHVIRKVFSQVIYTFSCFATSAMWFLCFLVDPKVRKVMEFSWRSEDHKVSHKIFIALASYSWIIFWMKFPSRTFAKGKLETHENYDGFILHQRYLFPLLFHSSSLYRKGQYNIFCQGESKVFLIH